MLECSEKGFRKLSLGIVLTSFIVVYCSQIFWPRLPSIGFLTVCVIALAIIIYIRKSASAPLGALIGLIWSASVGYWYLHWQPQDIQFQQDVLIIGQITGVTQADDKLRLSINASRIGEHEFWLQRNIRVNWYQPNVELKVGDRISFHAKLKPPRGLANPHSFDYERWLLSKNIVATGYLVSKSVDIIFKSQPTLREQLIARVKAVAYSQQRWLLSLSFGDREQLTRSDWNMLQVSGLSHLFAISGLHLGILAGILWAISRLLPSALNLFRLQAGVFQKMPQVNLTPLTLFLIIVICIGYAYLANWQLTVIRALVMLILGFGFLWLRIRLNLWQLISLVFMVFILLMPYSVYSNSFWLSISAIGIIAFYVWRWPTNSNSHNSHVLRYLQSSVRVQVLLSVLIAPFIISQFGIFSLLAIALNLFAVPFITILVVPLCLLAVALMLIDLPVYTYLFALANSLIEYFFRVIHLAISNDYLVWQNLSLSVVALLLLFCSLLLAGMPRFLCQYRIILLCVMPVLAEALMFKSSVDNWTIHVLDVGQGTAIAISQGNKVVLADTGAKFKSGFNMGDAVVIPFLTAYRHQSIDHLIISHNDNDHAGSVDVIKDALQVNNLIDPSNCQQGQKIEWQRLSISVLWPTEKERHSAQLSKNNLSCVVKVSDGHRSVLLSGDIETIAEQRLVDSINQNTHLSLQADVLIAPHHGSKTSSSLLFLRHVEPVHTVYTTAYLNRWKFPNTNVTERYQRLGVKQWNTSKTGYLRITVPYNKQDDINVESWRNHLNRRWYGQGTKN